MEAVRGWLETGLAQRFNGRRIAICGSRLTMGSSMLGPSSKRRCRGAISTTGRRGPATNSRPTVTHTKLSFTQAVEIRHFVVPHGAIFHLHAGSTRVVEPGIKTHDGVWVRGIAFRDGLNHRPVAEMLIRSDLDQRRRSGHRVKTREAVIQLKGSVIRSNTREMRKILRYETKEINSGDLAGVQAQLAVKKILFHPPRIQAELVAASIVAYAHQAVHVTTVVDYVQAFV